jgi:hypothetical protein
VILAQVFVVALSFVPPGPPARDDAMTRDQARAGGQADRRTGPHDGV